jgi:hypothetical protein
MQRNMILVCHAADGHFADGDREGVCRVLARSEYVVNHLGQAWYEIICADGGTLELYAPGLEEPRAFHRMELLLPAHSLTLDVLTLIHRLMQAGGFGLMDGLDTSQVIVTLPQQVVYFPWIPEPPLLARTAHDLAHTIGYS